MSHSALPKACRDGKEEEEEEEEEKKTKTGDRYGTGHNAQGQE